VDVKFENAITNVVPAQAGTHSTGGQSYCVTVLARYGFYMDASLLPRFFCMIRQDKIAFLYPAFFAIDIPLHGPDVIR
jgi:hypothetical protein